MLKSTPARKKYTAAGCCSCDLYELCICANSALVQWSASKYIVLYILIKYSVFLTIITVTVILIIIIKNVWKCTHYQQRDSITQLLLIWGLLSSALPHFPVSIQETQNKIVQTPFFEEDVGIGPFPPFLHGCPRKWGIPRLWSKNQQKYFLRQKQCGFIVLYFPITFLLGYFVLESIALMLFFMQCWVFRIWFLLFLFHQWHHYYRSNWYCCTTK